MQRKRKRWKSRANELNSVYWSDDRMEVSSRSTYYIIMNWSICISVYIIHTYSYIDDGHRETIRTTYNKILFIISVYEKPVSGLGSLSIHSICPQNVVNVVVDVCIHSYRTRNDRTETSVVRGLLLLLLLLCLLYYIRAEWLF